MRLTPRTLPANYEATSTLRWWNHLEDKWNELQVGRQGSYSVERLESFDHYCKTTSLMRVIVVCAVTPLPALLAAILLESLPLRPPSEGWAANWMFWIRLTAANLIMTFAGVSQIVTIIPDLNPTFWKRVLITWGSTIAYVGVFMLGASEIVFPIPFLWTIGGVFRRIFISVMQVIAFGVEPFKKTSPCYRNLQRHLKYYNAYIVLLNIFPFCRVLYDSVPVTFQSIAIVVLPISRLAAKQYMVKATRDMEDFMPGIVAMTVDLFSTLFVSVCMSTRDSAYLSFLFIAIDIGQTLLEFREVRSNAGVVLNLLRDRHASSEHFRKTSSKRTLASSNLMDLILEVTRDPHAFHVKFIKDVRLQACYPHQLTHQQKAKLDYLHGSHVYCSLQSTSTTRIKQPHQKRQRCWLPHRRIHSPSATVAPKTIKIKEAISPKRAAADIGLVNPFAPHEVLSATVKHNDASGEKSRKVVVEGLQLLFHCEYLVLVEYVECVVPLVYVLYKVALENLPNVAYYPGGAGHFGPSAVALVCNT
ncbi:unnamed protein product [Phytophthora lilii]|uniref:Unnamed protein product n=1 Tax=Phytophthora lilii TaxID=2077276 RepID=A0A9W6U2V7_9STRA|nr:unnamed protein product [Phytophthora lilii]